MAELLLLRGAAVETGRTLPLANAAGKGHKEAVELLLAKGASASARGSYYYAESPILEAASGGHAQVVDLLLQEGADASDQTHWGGWTPLHRAASLNHVEVVKLLLAHGADASLVNSNGDTPLQLAQREGHQEIVEYQSEHVRKAAAEALGQIGDPRAVETLMVFLHELTMIPVPAGTFQRDSTAANKSTVSAFSMSETAITRAQWAAVTGLPDPSDTDYSTGTDDPVQQVNWYEALMFCNKLSLREGLTPVYTICGSTDPDDWGTLSLIHI